MHWNGRLLKCVSCKSFNHQTKKIRATLSYYSSCQTSFCKFYLLYFNLKPFFNYKNQSKIFSCQFKNKYMESITTYLLRFEQFKKNNAQIVNFTLSEKQGRTTLIIFLQDFFHIYQKVNHKEIKSNKPQQVSISTRAQHYY